MKNILFLLFIIQGVVMGAMVENVKVKDIDVPFIYEVDTNLPTVNIQIVFKNSGIVQNKKAGLSNMVAKLLNEGTKKDGATKFANKLESRAIDLSAQSGTETFVFEISCLKSEVEYAISLLKQLLKDPNYTQDNFEKITEVSLGNLMQKKSDFDYVASIKLKEILYKGTVLQYPSSGTIDTIKSITLDDIKSFVKSNFVIQNAMIVAGGDIDVESIRAQLVDVVSILPKAQTSDLTFISTTKTAKSVKLYENTQQAYIYFGSPYYVNVLDEDAYMAKVANFILGSSGFGSRLMEEIRVKKGLAYSAYSKQNINKSHSYFSGYLQTKLESQDEAISLVTSLISEFVKNGATQEELDGAKKFLLGSEPLRNETLSQRLSRAFMEYYRGASIGSDVQDLEKISNLTLEDLNKFIKKHDEINNLSFSIVTKKDK